MHDHKMMMGTMTHWRQQRLETMTTAKWTTTGSRKQWKQDMDQGTVNMPPYDYGHLHTTLEITQL
jgi:hypothetical protein